MNGELLQELLDVCPDGCKVVLDNTGKGEVHLPDNRLITDFDSTSDRSIRRAIHEIAFNQT